MGQDEIEQVNEGRSQLKGIFQNIALPTLGLTVTQRQRIDFGQSYLTKGGPQFLLEMIVG